jgi:RNA polymerase sigma-70 factor (ECF subfamily)
MTQTSVILLERVRQRSDQEAWSRFVRLYTPLIFSWGRQCGLQPDDAADLTQDVLTVLLQKLPEFTYNHHGSFRAWLRTVTLNQWRDRRKRIATRPLAGVGADLDEMAAPEASSLEEAEYRQQLVSRALRLIQGDFQPTTWRAFWEHGVEGRPAAQVAAELGLSLNAVYTARFRVLARLRQELTGLLD